MRLTLSTRHPRNSTYTTETGEVLYKVDTIRKFPDPGVTTIRKAVDTVNGVWLGDSEQLSGHRAKPTFPEGKSLVSDKGGDDHSIDGRRSADSGFAVGDSEHGDESRTRSSVGEMPVREGYFAFYAQIDFRVFRSTRFQWDGHDVSVNKYFHEEGWSGYGRGRVFKASDGKEYRWELRTAHLEMVRNDGGREQVARYREKRPGLGPLMTGRPAVLEVDPSCEPILDEIMMTFLYCYKLRKDRERAARKF
ncbi:hypothetical protein P691DRAFT_714273 [Macrolepiota fuliginosa MF-IS2]|uniref:DUF6593 domain-containing protein n=1 Tax=Macrolepiota fuliginosa MF-IS2 TaxID=1400762 RepID=A0A9P5X3I0_9AGAR|nr:hypothetical protein P691DRAFT_714273 [Macrolepiota fuliginosa MF-IS2]